MSPILFLLKDIDLFFVKLGVWYTQNKTCTCYFKSTDGHINNWTFSSKRLNLDVALKASQSQGCIIVDSTRRGKRFPDSMSHTIPIWCGVLNHVVIGTDIADSLSLPPWTPSSLADSICSCFKTIVSGLHTDVVELIRSNLCGVLHRPLRPVWCSAEEGKLPSCSIVIKKMPELINLYVRNDRVVWNIGRRFFKQM